MQCKGSFPFADAGALRDGGRGAEPEALLEPPAHFGPLFDDFEPDRSLPRDDTIVVERRNDSRSGFLRNLSRK